jgi:hypothetical protein
VRGSDQQTDHLFSYVSPEQRVPQDHPLRPIREMVDAALRGLSPAFEEMYSWTGRPSIPPEQIASRPAAAGPVQRAPRHGRGRVGHCSSTTLLDRELPERI